MRSKGPEAFAAVPCVERRDALFRTQLMLLLFGFGLRFNMACQSSMRNSDQKRITKNKFFSARNLRIFPNAGGVFFVEVLWQHCYIAILCKRPRSFRDPSSPAFRL